MSNVLLFAFLFVGNLGVIAADPAPALREDGYRRIWYMNQPAGDEFAYKYSGGLRTYCAHHIPMAVYSPEAEKTFFVYGGRSKEKTELLEMVSFYDHRTGTVPRPVCVAVWTGNAWEFRDVGPTTWAAFPSSETFGD